ncbi:hypothetical protein FJY63_13900, partial [Candidatus Sumerlaeota bacterium]|nr:hypothetical protein [Candidatus Sumerlaeota bacterium]
TAYAGFYYGWGGARVLSDHYPKKSRHLFYYPKGDKALLPGVTEEIVSDVVKALRHKPQRYWETLAQEHEKWRLGRGEKLTHKRR